MESLSRTDGAPRLGRELARIKEGSPSGLPMILGVLAAFVGLAIAIELRLPPLWMLLIGGTSGGLLVIATSLAMATRLSVYEHAVVAQSLVRRTVIERDWIRRVTWNVREVFYQGMHTGDQYQLRIEYEVGPPEFLAFEWFVRVYEPSEETDRLLETLEARLEESGDQLYG